MPNAGIETMKIRWFVVVLLAAGGGILLVLYLTVHRWR